MLTSILDTTKKLIGGAAESNYFDEDILVHVNSAMTRAFQLGVFSEPVVITDSAFEWEGLNLRPDILAMLKTFVYLKVKRGFDPPETASMMQALDDAIKEQEWLLEVFSRQEV